MSWLNSPQAQKAWAMANQHNLAVDVIINREDNSSALPAIMQLANRFPRTRIVLEHVLYPRAERGPRYGLSDNYLKLAQHQNIYIKFSTINLDWLQQRGADLPGFVRRLVDVYGSERVMWGSDLGNSGGSYADLISRALAATARLNDLERRNVLRETGMKVYALQPMRP
jgi:predicted TIM-barrel fold metal-dependent hydrolase